MTSTRSSVQDNAILEISKLDLRREEASRHDSLTLAVLEARQLLIPRDEPGLLDGRRTADELLIIYFL